MLDRFVPVLGFGAVLGVGSVLFAAPAQAAGTGTVSVGTYLQYKAASGKQNKLVVTRSGTTITFDDSVPLKAGQGCRAVSGHKTVVTCTLANPGTVIVTLGDRNDSFVNRTGLRFNVYGGSGNDKLYGWIVPVVPDGGPPVEQDPDDDMVGGALDGGAGDDLCREGRTGTQVNCES